MGNVQPSGDRPAPLVSVIGCGGFGQLVLQSLAPHCPVKGFDPVAPEKVAPHAQVLSWASAAQADIVVLAMPVQELEQALLALRPHLRPGTTVVDVCSVKEGPVEMMRRLVPAECAIVGTHPLFGPQSARFGLRGATLALVPVRGTAHRRLAAFFRSQFGLRVVVTKAEEHDRQMAYVQGLTHMIARIVARMAIPPITLKTRPFALMEEIGSLVGKDSDRLFAAIMGENRFAAEALRTFATAFGDQIDRTEQLLPLHRQAG